MAQPTQYAQFPKFEYQTIERHYQTFDPHTLKFSYYPVNSTSTDGLTPNKDQGTTDAPLAAEPPKDDPVPDPAPATEDGSDSPSDASSSSPEAGGTLIQPFFAPSPLGLLPFLPLMINHPSLPPHLPWYMP